MVSILLPEKHVRALTAIKKQTGETRSETIRSAVAVELARRAQTSAEIRRILNA